MSFLIGLFLFKSKQLFESIQLKMIKRPRKKVATVLKRKERSVETQIEEKKSFSKRKTKKTFQFTGIDEKEIAKYQKFFSKRNDSIILDKSQSFNQLDILISNGSARTLKIMYALVFHVPIFKSTYIDYCMEDGEYPEFQDRDFKNETWSEIITRNDKLTHDRLNSKDENIPIAFYLNSESAITFEELNPIIQKSGGILFSKHNVNGSEKIDFYIVEKDEEFNVKDAENAKKCNLKWLFDCI
jgi:hypothetical protein